MKCFVHLNLCWLSSQPAACKASGGSQGRVTLASCSTPAWGDQSTGKPGPCSAPSRSCMQHHSNPSPVAALDICRTRFALLSNQPATLFTLQGNFLVFDCLITLLVVSVFPWSLKVAVNGCTNCQDFLSSSRGYCTPLKSRGIAGAGLMPGKLLGWASCSHFAGGR